MLSPLYQEKNLICTLPVGNGKILVKSITESRSDSYVSVWKSLGNPEKLAVKENRIDQILFSEEGKEILEFLDIENFLFSS